MKLTLCKKASIFSLDNQFLCDAAVSNIEENTCCLIMSAQDADLLRSEVIITFYDDILGLVTCYCRLSGFKEYLEKPGKWQGIVMCTAERELSVVQRRNDIKVATSFQITLNFTKEEDVIEEAPAHVHNISAGGLFITSRQHFLPGDTFHFMFSPHQKELTLRVEILRVQDPYPEQLSLWSHKKAEQESIFGYGCRFIDLSPYDEAQIRNFVFRQDVLIRQRSLFPPEFGSLT